MKVLKTQALFLLKKKKKERLQRKIYPRKGREPKILPGLYTAGRARRAILALAPEVKERIL